MGTCQKGNGEDLQRGIDAAREAFGSWKSYPAPRRGEILLRAASIMRRRKEELAATISLEMGKVVAEARGKCRRP